jgi:thiamine-phosphate pyrophosphorylase
MPIVTAAVAAAVGLGATGALAIQVRLEDDVTDRAAFDLTLAILEICRPAGVIVLVNDRLDVALAAGADGAHVGADDLPPPAARAVLGPDAMLGVTCRTPIGITADATYLGVGPAFATSTKDGLPNPIGTAGVGAVAAAAAGRPVIAIGGVTVARAPDLLRAGTYGVAVVGAVSRAADPGRATAELLKVLS